ncbi:MAG TPA: cytochrome P450 [Jatrophihabitantaceae bacterium]
MTSIGAAVTVDELDRDPHPVLARLRAAEPVSWLPALQGWLVTRYDLVDQLLRDPATFTVDDPRFSTAQVVGPSMLSLDGAEHARHRAPFTRSFRPREVHDRFAALVVNETRRLIAELPPGRAELRHDLAGPLSVAVVATALGLSTVDAPTVLQWYDAIVSAVSGVSAGRAIPESATTAFAQLHASVAATVARRDETSLVGAADLAVDEVVSNAAVLMFGGIETTEGMICNLAVHVLSRPESLAALRADRTLIPAAVEESLRLEPAAAVVDRYATRDVELGGARIRAGDLVTASIAGANRDPAVFADPHRFDLGRGNVRQQLAFARGPHVCIGLDLARLEAATALGALLDLPGLRLADEAAARGLVFRKPPAVHVIWHN